MARLALRSDILLASPSDVRTRLAEVEEAIHAWNALNSDAYSIVFRPIKWEMDAVPAWGVGAQDCINHELVDNADGLIALFWHRLGEPTREHASGTVEEIERFASRGKRPAIYVSNEPVPKSVDVSQLHAFRNFEHSARERGFVRTFAHQIELRQLCLHYLTALAPVVLREHQGAVRPDQMHGSWNDIGDAFALGEALRQMVYSRRQLEVLLERVVRMDASMQSAGLSLSGTEWERVLTAFEEAVMRLPETTHSVCRSMLVEVVDLRSALSRPLLVGGPNLLAARDHLLPALVDYMLGIEDLVREALAANSEQSARRA